MTSYYRLMLGRKSMHAPECLAGGFIGTDYGIKEDLTEKLPDGWREFNRQFIPIYLASHPDKTKIGAGRYRRVSKRVTLCSPRTARDPTASGGSLAITTMSRDKCCLTGERLTG
jgi:hypothetical protein